MDTETLVKEPETLAKKPQALPHDLSELALVRPSFALKASYIDALRDGHSCGNEPQRSREDIARIEADFAAHIEKLNRQGATVTWPNGETGTEVPYQRLWLTDGERFMGETMVRFALNNYYSLHRGHISYGVAPAWRGRGLATRILRADLALLAGRGIKQALLTCSVDNEASIKVIRKNGGRMIDVCRFPWKPTPLTARFAIDL